MDIQGIVYTIAVSCIPLMMGIIFHEVAHGYVAYLCGDTTAKAQGRLTLNPIPHIDPMGTAFFVLTAVMGPFVFGWAKPVPVNPMRFMKIKDAKLGMLLVGLSGPMTNFLLAILFAILTKVLLFVSSYSFLMSPAGTFLQEMFVIGIQINLILMIINLIPIPPLDGSHIVAKFLPYPLDSQYMSFGRYGMLVLLILIMTNIIGSIIQFFLGFILPIFINFIV